MIRSNIVEMTQRQFDEAMGREAVEIEDFYSHETYKVLMRKSTRGTKSNESIIIFYPQDCNIVKGTMIKYKNNKYLVMSQDSGESDVYFTSAALKCNADVITYGGTTTSTARNAGWYHKTPFVVNTFSGVNPSGSFIEVVNGNLNMSTSKQDYFTQINIGNDVLDFGGKFEIVNTFFLDGIHNIYLKKGLTNTNDEYIGLYDIGEVHVGDTVELHNVAVNLSNYSEYLEDVDGVTYTVSDTSKASITDGVLTLLAEGTFTITVKKSGYNDYVSPIITVGEAETPVNPPEPTEITWSKTHDFENNTYINSSYHTICTIAPSEETDKTVTWKLQVDDTLYDINSSDLVGYISISVSANTYSIDVSPKKSEMALYVCTAKAYVDDVLVAESNPTTFRV